MALYLIGLGLSDEKDITVKGLEAVKKCSKLYLENYTSFLQCSVKDLERFYKKKIQISDRDFVENHTKEILSEAKKGNVAVLVVGDPLIATTHVELLIEAKKQKIRTEVIHNASVVSAIGITGLHIYKFGKTVSIPYERKNVESPYDTLLENKRNGMHTLVLMDLKEKENVTIKEAIEYLLGLEQRKKKNVFTPETTCVGCARLGSKNATIKFGTALQLMKQKFGKAPYCLIVPGSLHFKEEEYLEMFRIR